MFLQKLSGSMKWNSGASIDWTCQNFEENKDWIRKKKECDCEELAQDAKLSRTFIQNMMKKIQTYN